MNATVFALLTTVAAAPVTPQVSLDRDAILAGQATSVFVLLELEGAAAKKAQTRRPLNVSLVIDRSCSMQDGKKMVYAKEAAARLVDALAPADHVSIVEYDSKVTTVWPASPVTNKRMIKKRIRSLSPRGGTDLTSGMMRGANETEKFVAKDRISRVILLSDGRANEGVTEPATIAQMVRKQKARGTPITTMGLGDDYNEDLMEMIAEVGGGRYYFIEHPEQIARIFEEEMSVLVRSVAKNVRVRFDAGSLVRKVEVIGYTATTKGPRTTVAHDDVYAGEKRSMLVRLHLADAKPGRFNLGTILLEYLDIETARAVADEREVYVTVTADAAVADAAQNQRVVAESTLIEADAEERATTKLYERGDKRRAKSRLARMGQKLKRVASRTKDRRLSKKAAGLALAAEDMDASDASTTYRKKFLKKRKRSGGLGTRGKRTGYLLDSGSSGYQVERLQTALKKIGLYTGAVDGSFSPAVAAAVSAFQTKQGLEVDGVAGPMTLRALGLY